MPLNATTSGLRTFFADPALDEGLPRANEEFWASLIRHVEADSPGEPRVILDIGCHTGGLLEALARRFRPVEIFGIEPLSDARSRASLRLSSLSARVRLLDSSEWGQIPDRVVDLVTSHEELYLEHDLREAMERIRRVLAPTGFAYIVLGAHAENPLWHEWKKALIATDRRVYDHAPLAVMRAASEAGFLPSVQPLRRSGWVTYDPLHADFPYPDVRTMLDHHYRQKLIFRLQVADAAPATP